MFSSTDAPATSDLCLTAHTLQLTLLPTEPCFQPLLSWPDLTLTCTSPGRRAGARRDSPLRHQKDHMEEVRRPGLTDFFFSKPLSLLSARSVSLSFMVYFPGLGLGFLLLRKRKEEEAIRWCQRWAAQGRGP